MSSYILPFLIGGVLTEIIAMVAENYGPKYGALCYALPIGFIVTIMLISKDENHVHEYTYHCIASGFCIFLYILLFFGMFKLYGHSEIYKCLGISTLIWLIVTIIIFKLL